MSKVTLYLKDSVEYLEDVENFSVPGGGLPYWMVKLSDKRVFFAFDTVERVVVEGEEEIIAAAQARVGNPEELARQLGIEP